MWLKPNQTTLEDSEPYTGTDGTRYPANFPKAEIAELAPVTLSARPATTEHQDAAYVILGGIQVWAVTDWAPERIAAVYVAKREAIKAERDRRKSLGIKVGADWFHSDDGSRIQQLGLVLMGAGVPVGLQWKTLTHAGTVFVAMTPALATSVFQATAASDQAIFAAAEVHQTVLLAAADPTTYNVTTGWPASFEDAP